MVSKTLRDLVSSRIEGRWSQWASAHPNLAEVIDRTSLIESTVDRLRLDPAFSQALEQAGLDEATLAAAVKLVEQAERLVNRVMPISMAS